MSDKENKKYTVQFRVTESEYLDILMKTTGSDGSQMMTVNQFGRAATLGGKVVIVDSEVLRYRAFVMAQLGNLRNQLVKRLHEDHKASLVTESTYVEILNKLEEEAAEQRRLLEPLE